VERKKKIGKDKLWRIICACQQLFVMNSFSRFLKCQIFFHDLFIAIKCLDALGMCILVQVCKQAVWLVTAIVQTFGAQLRPKKRSNDVHLFSQSILMTLVYWLNWQG
jgi:hypothetical protein